MSYHYEPVARQRYHIRCLGDHIPCNFHNEEAESAGQAEEIAKNTLTTPLGAKTTATKIPT